MANLTGLPHSPETNTAGELPEKKVSQTTSPSAVTNQTVRFPSGTLLRFIWLRDHDESLYSRTL